MVEPSEVAQPGASREGASSPTIWIDPSRWPGQAPVGWVDQVADQAGQLAAALLAVVEELRTLGDPDAAAVQIEAVTTEADQRVAEAIARVARAERNLRLGFAEAQRGEADAAAEEATERADQLAAQLQEALSDKRHGRSGSKRGPRTASGPRWGVAATVRGSSE